MLLVTLLIHRGDELLNGSLEEIGFSGYSDSRGCSGGSHIDVAEEAGELES